MKLEFTINKNTDPTVAGEMLMSVLNHKERWGYMTHDFDCDYVECTVSLETDRIPIVLCCGEMLDDEYKRVGKYHLPYYNLDVYLYWDGDGTIVFHSLKEDWVFYNTDMKNSYNWYLFEKE